MKQIIWTYPGKYRDVLIQLMLRKQLFKSDGNLYLISAINEHPQFHYEAVQVIFSIAEGYEDLPGIEDLQRWYDKLNRM